jgi:hypothetical protein
VVHDEEEVPFPGAIRAASVQLVGHEQPCLGPALLEEVLSGQFPLAPTQAGVVQGRSKSTHHGGDVSNMKKLTAGWKDSVSCVRD